MTKRSRGLRSFSGHVSLPGGKADDEHETFEQVARREAEEEIGLPQGSKELHEMFGMKIENICDEMPCYLSRTFLSVKPLVCFLHNETDPQNSTGPPLDASRFFGKLNPGETSSLFSVPLNDMVCHLYKAKLKYEPEYIDRREYFPKWGGLKWPIRHYFYPVENENDVAWLNDIPDASSGDEFEDGKLCRDLWGLTAKILYDLSSIANGIVKSDDATKSIAHEDLIYGLYELAGQLKPVGRSTWEIGMITGKKGYQYGDVIPGDYMEMLRKISTKY